MKWVRVGDVSYNQAKVVLRRYESDSTFLRLGLHGEGEMLFSELLDEYYEYQENTPNKSAYTLKQEKYRLDFFISESPDFKIAQIDCDSINRWFKSKNYKPNTVRLTVLAIRAVYKFAIKRNYISQDLTKGLQVPKMVKNPPKHLTEKQVTTLLNAMSESSRRPYEIMYYTGLRPKECLSLKVKNINFDSATIDLYPDQTKTAERGILPIHPKLKNILSDLTKDKKEEDYLFPHPKKKGEHQESLKNAIRRASHATGIPASPYQFRHTFATQVLDKTRDLRTVQQLMRHKSISMTTRYATSLDERLKEAVEMLGAIV